MSSMSELYFDHFLVSPDFLMDIKLEPMDYELCKIACTEEDLKMCKEEFDNFEMQKVDVGLSSPLNVWLPCPGLTGAEDLDLEPTDKSEVEEEQMGFDWPRMESDWLVREVRGSDWLPPVREPDWQLQKFVDPPLPQHRNSNCLLAPHSHELLSQMKPCSVLLDSSTVPKYLSCRNPNMKPKRKQTSLKKTAQKRKKKPATIAVPTQFKTMPPNTFLNLKYLEKNNPDFIYTDFSKSKRGQKYRRQLSNGIQSDSITDTSSRSSIDSESTALYQCPYCLSLFFTEFEFRYHVSQKLSNNSRMYCIDAVPSMFECVDCLQVFESRHGFNKHMGHQHSTSVSCDTCKESFTYVCQLNKHQHTFLHFNSTPITCKLCDMEFPNNYCLDSHNFFWHESLYQCQTCGICFQNATKLECHMYVLHGSPTSTKPVNVLFSQTKTSELVKPTSANPVSILIPQKTSQIITKPQQMKLTTFKPTSILFVPNLPQPLPGLVKLEPQDTPCEENASACWPCEKCNKSYKLVENFIAHWKKKHSSDPLPSWFSQLIFCASPDKVREIFVRDLDVPESPKIDEIKEEPVETVTTGPEKVHATLKLHVCLRCEKIYKNIASLKKHMTFEHEYEDLLNEIEEHIESNISCTFCMKKLHNDTYLHAHMISKHPHHVKYKCSECHLTFETSNLYSRHFRVVHKIEKMFQCNVCSFSYTSSYHLSMHMLRYHNQRMVHCPHCRHDHSFSAFLQRHFGKCAPDLAFHMCPLCGVIFEELKDARLHVVEQHLKKCKRILHCDICINSFFSKSNLTAHIKNRHFKKYKINNLCLIE